MMICAGCVFRCFKTLERWGNYLTGAAGPFFVGLACILFGLGVICFFDVLAPTLPFPILTIPICTLIVVNLLMHYYYCVTVRPGFVDGDGEPLPGLRELGTIDSVFWAKRRDGKGKVRAARSPPPRMTPAEHTRCTKCNILRPERSHHCKICNRCVLKYDHHCPVSIPLACPFLSDDILQWLNQCVGLHNERHFVLFMAYLVISSFSYCTIGYGKFIDSVGFTLISDPWPHHIPEMFFSLTYVLCAVLGFALIVMLSFHFWGILNGETSVEAQDHDSYRRRAAERAEAFVNSYDLGKRRNFELFFNIGEGGYPITTFFFPLRIHPYTDGYSWARKEGYERHAGLMLGEELTDDEDDYVV